MALRVAVATGNWSNPAIWNGGVLPSAGDIVASNNFIVTIDQNIHVNTLTNAAANAVAESANMTSNTTPSGIASSNDEGYSTFAWQAFANNVYQGADVSGRWITFGTPSVSSPKWLAYEFTTPKIIVYYTIRHNAASTGIYDPVSWTFEAWDGTNWIVLDTRTNEIHTVIEPGYSVTNSTAYLKYRINITATNGGNNVQIYEFRMYSTTLLSSAVAGGGFVLTDGVSVVATNNVESFIQSQNTLFTYNGTTSTSLSGKLSIYYSYSVATYYLVNHTGSGTLNFTGDLVLTARNGYANFNLTGAGTLNYTGNITVATGATEIRSRFLHLVGTLSTAYITGTINTVASSTGYTYNVFGTLNGKLYITGNILMGHFPIINSGESSLLSIIGTISKDNVLGTLNEGVPAIIRSSATAINLFSGPFISSRYGAIPIQCVRMHLIPSVGTYFEFRDETTNGALSPGAIAPATRMIAPAAVSDAPAPANVRFGTTYSLGSQTGTCRIPATNTVAAGVEVDNTVGSAVLSPSDVWDAPTSTMTTAGSIGLRLKNTSTVDTTGDQIAALL